MSVDRLVVASFLTFFLIGCAQSKFESEADIWKYIREPDNGLIQEVTVDNYTLSVYYKPKALLILQELNSISSKELSSLKSKYASYDYFIVEYKKSDGVPMYDNDGSSYSDLLRSIAYQFQNYALITNKRDLQVLPVDFSYFPTYNLRDRLELLLIFNNDQYQTLDKIDFHVREVGFGIGDQIFEFDLEKIKSIPEFNWKTDQSKNQ